MHGWDRIGGGHACMGWDRIGGEYAWGETE